VWGQRYHGIVGFPVALEERYLFRPTKTGDTYLARILPQKSSPGRFVFDIWITDMEGTPHEAVLGLMMQDVSGGRMTPTDWIARHRPEGRSVDPDVASLSGAGGGHCVMELAAVKPAAVKILSEGEYERFWKLGRRRQKSFLGARLCLKRLSRMLSGHDDAAPATAIHTLDSDRVRPGCPLTDGTHPYFCSVSHDSRFVVAVASESRVGVDVERLTDKVVKSRRIYMHEEEIFLTDRSPLGKTGASLRVWSVKEAMAKAFHMTLAEAWDRVVVRELGQARSRVSLDENEYGAVHHQVGDHVFTLVETGLE
jgi:phosphopantetheinyl transferase